MCRNLIKKRLLNVKKCRNFINKRPNKAKLWEIIINFFNVVQGFLIFFRVFAVLFWDFLPIFQCTSIYCAQTLLIAAQIDLIEYDAVYFVFVESFYRIFTDW